jgi:hypothetical protein
MHTYTFAPLYYAKLGQQIQATLIRSMLGNLPPAETWKTQLRDWIDEAQQLSDVQQTQQLETLKTCRERFDLEGLLQLGRNYTETSLQIQKNWLNWANAVPTLFSHPLFDFAQHSLDSRGDGDALLAVNALDQNLRPRWNAHLGDLMGLCCGVLPAYRACLGQYLQTEPEMD